MSFAHKMGFSRFFKAEDQEYQHDIIWQPQDKQKMGLECPADEMFYGGAKGGGKSDFLLALFLKFLHYGSNHNAIIFRRTYTEFEELLDRSHEIYPSQGGYYQITKRTWIFPQGQTLKMRFLELDKDVHRYQGHQYNLIMFDELTNWPTDYCYTYMFSCMRSPTGVPCYMRAAGNPGSIGHAWVQHRFIKGHTPYDIYTDEKTQLTRCFIPALLDDNTILMKNDPNYEKRLRTLPDHLYEAYRWGNWDIFEGQAFTITPRHICSPRTIPEGAQRYMTFDWGFGKPFSLLWWWVDADGRIFLYDEWYGYDGTPDKGLRYMDSQIAEGIIAKEQEHPGGYHRDIIRLAGHDCFSKKPDYKGGGQGKSTAEVFSEHGIHLTVGDPSRNLKIRQFRERLRVPDDPDKEPMMMVYENCTEFMRTIPLLQVSRTNQEDIDTKGEDHAYDSACHICMHRPITPMKDRRDINPNELRLAELERVTLSDVEAYYIANQIDKTNAQYGMTDVILDYQQQLNDAFVFPSDVYYDHF